MIRDQRTPHRLALLGGEPYFQQPLHVGRPNIGDRGALLGRINGILDRGWLTNDGPCVREFEARVAAYAGVKHAVAMCNATIALEIVIRAANMRGEVLVPAYTFVATAHALQWQEITPVFCDIDPDTHCIDPVKIEEMITPRTTGIIGVHVWGQPCAVDALQEIADRRGLTLLFDAAHAFGCSYRGRKLGSFGRAEVFSFHATKFFNTFEGGAVVTNDDELAERMRLMRNFGFVNIDKVTHLGTNGKMPEVCAAMGLSSFESLELFVDVNRTNYRNYQRALSGLPGLKLKLYDEDGAQNYQYIVVELDSAACPLTRDDIVDLLWSENCLARRYFWPGVHNMEPYRSYYPHAHLLLEETQRVAERVFLLPTGTAVNSQMIEAIGAILRAGFDSHAQLRAALSDWRKARATT